MFGLLNSSQIYGLQQAHEHHIPSTNHKSNLNNNNHNNNCNSSGNRNNNSNNNKNNKHRRSTASVADNRFFASLASKSPTNFIEKFLKTDLLNGYDTIKNYKNIQHILTTNLQTSSTTTNTNTTTTTTTATGLVSSTSTSISSTASTVTTSTGTTTLSPATSASATKPSTTTTYSDTILAGFNCLQGSYRTSCDSEFYEAINPNNNKNIHSNNNNNKNTNSNSSYSSNNKFNQQKLFSKTRDKSPDMTIKCSKNLLAEPPQNQAPATLQNYQKLPDDIAMDILIPSSGASSGEFNNNNDNGTNNSTTNNLYKRLSWGSRNSKNFDLTQCQTNGNEVPSDNSTSSISTTTQSSTNTTTSTSTKSNDLQRSSSASSSGDCAAVRERKKTLEANMAANSAAAISPERAQRRKLIQMISSYEQQNKVLQRELAKEKRRRTEELSCVAKSLLCFEAKLKNDMKTVNQRLMERDIEICRLVSQNRALKKKLKEFKKTQNDQACDEGVVEDDGGADESLEHIGTKHATNDANEDEDDEMMEDCLVLEALQCINCKKQFYDIDLKENAESVNGSTQNVSSKDGNRKHDNHHATEHGSSSDDTVSSSFYGARRSVRYTSKRTSGTFRDYMRSRSMNIDDPALEQNSEENTSTISRDDSQTSYEKLNVYSRTIERMHGVKNSGKSSDVEQPTRASSRLSNKSSSSKGSNKDCEEEMQNNQKREQIEEDDGIFSPTQDDDFDEFGENVSGPNRSIKIVPRRSAEFSEASPKQVYETSTDDWYASASDQEEITVGATTTSKSYGQGAVNPVLECVNQILLQQSMEEGPSLDEPSPPSIVIVSEPTTPLNSKPSNLVHSSSGNLPRRSSLSGRRSSRSNSHSSDGGPNSRNGTLTRKRVHFSTKNSMVHVPRNDEEDDDDDSVLATPMISSLQSPTYHQAIYSYGSNTQMSSTHTPPIAETLNYESIYSNEYEPIGSEKSSSNLYVDMDAANKLGSPIDTKTSKMPPALPPKPANLLKFKKSLQQLDESPDEHLPQDSAASVSNSATSEPDYCSISEVNVAVTSVQTVADVHKAPESVASLDTRDSELDLEVSTVASDDDICGASQKTDEIEEIFADIPKLPNVAAIIAPKEKNQNKLSTLGYQHNPPNLSQQLSNDYMLMSPKVANNTNNSLTLPNSNKITNKNNNNLTLQNTNKNPLIPTTPVTTKNNNNSLLTSTPQRPSNLRLDLGNSALKTNLHGSQYKRKHMPNILAEINKRMSQPNSPTTPTKPTISTPTKNKQQFFPPSAGGKAKTSPLQTPQELLKSLEDSSSNSLPLQAEFDWYNLDAEYGRTPNALNDQIKLSETLNSNGSMLAEISEDHESIVTAADEYNLDEEFSLAPEINESHDISENHDNSPMQALEPLKIPSNLTPANNLCETINFPVLEPEGSPIILPTPGSNTKATKIKNNLANFEKFIEGSGLSTKPLPSKRKIYFAGPFV